MLRKAGPGRRSGDLLGLGLRFMIASIFERVFRIEGLTWGEVLGLGFLVGVCSVMVDLPVCDVTFMSFDLGADGGVCERLMDRGRFLTTLICFGVLFFGVPGGGGIFIVLWDASTCNFRRTSIRCSWARLFWGVTFS